VTLIAGSFLFRIIRGVIFLPLMSYKRINWVLK